MDSSTWYAWWWHKTYNVYNKPLCQGRDRRRLQEIVNGSVHHAPQLHMVLLLLILKNNFSSETSSDILGRKYRPILPAIPPQLNWLPLRYLNLAASLTICKEEVHTDYRKNKQMVYSEHTGKGQACLIKSRIYVICELNFCNSSVSLILTHGTKVKQSSTINASKKTKKAIPKHWSKAHHCC